MINGSAFLNLFWQVETTNPSRFNDYLILAYVVLGGIALLYIVSLLVRQRNLQQDVALMRHLLEDEETP